MHIDAARPSIVPARLAGIADGLAVVVAVLLPWTTSGATIAICLWFAALLPTLDRAILRRVFSTAAGILPIALVLFGLVSAVWSIVPFIDAVKGNDSLIRLIAIPLLMAQFIRSDRGGWVVGGFLASCTALLALSFASWTWPSFFRFALLGIPVKDYVVQSGEFLLCAFGLAHLALRAWRLQRKALAISLTALAAMFVLNIAFVATGRASILVLIVLTFVFALQRFGWKGTMGVLAVGMICGSLAWTSSSYLRQRILDVSNEITAYQLTGAETSSGYRLEFWKKALAFMAEAPVIGHGSGSTRELYRRVAVGENVITATVTDNPHNQTLAIGIQLGFVGIAILYLMWAAHFFLFCERSMAAWIGLAIVLQNIVASLFNSQLFYFTPGWTYVFGVGVLGGTVLGRHSERKASVPD